MKLVDIRDRLIARMESVWTHSDIHVYFENTEYIDLTTVNDYFVKCDVEFVRAEQINIDPSPDQRTYGTLVLTVFGRETLGTRVMLGYLDELSDGFKFKNLSGVHLQAASPGGDVKQLGWLAKELRIGFYADSNA